MGRVVPTLGTLSRIAAALEVTVTHLLSDEAERRREDEVAHILADPFLTEIARVVEKLSAVQKIVTNGAPYASSVILFHSSKQRAEH